MPLFKMNAGRYYLIALIFIIVIVGTIGFAFILRPNLDAFRIARENFVSADAQQKSLGDKLIQARALTRQTALGSPAEIEKLKSIFIASPELSYVITSLQKYAEATRFLITSIEIGTGAPDKAVAGPLKTVSVQVQLKGGGYKELKEFLKLVTTSVPLYEVTSFTFDSASSSASLNLNAFGIKEDLARPIALDQKFFEDARFKALQAPAPLPGKDPVGKEDPFAPSAPAVSPAPVSQTRK